MNFYFRLIVIISIVLLPIACATNGPRDTGIPALSQEDVRVQLSKTVMPRQVKDKIIRLHHEDPVERAWAAYQLAKLGGGASPAVPYLINLMADDTPVLLSRYLGGGFHSSSDTSPADEASRALAKIGEKANPYLIEALKHKSANVRGLAAKAIGKIGETNSIDNLITALDDTDRRVRAMAAIALGSYHHPKAAEKIMDAMPKSGPSARADMVYALAQINDIIVVPFLIERLENEESNVRAAIVYALGKIRDARAVKVLLAGLADKDELVRANSVYSLSNYYAPQVVEALINAMNDEIIRVREAASEALEVLTGKRYGTDRTKWQNWWNSQKGAMQQDKKK